MKSFFSKPSGIDPELQSLKEELAQARGELALAYSCFDRAVDPELVESCIYQISAVKARCNYLIRSIKKRCPDAALPAALCPADLPAGEPCGIPLGEEGAWI